MLALARPLPWLAGFGIVHGFHEWGYLFIPIQSGYLPLPATEGLLVLHVDTDVPLAALVTTRGTVAEGVPRGHHVWLVRAAAGSYRWREIQVATAAGRFHRERLRGEDATRFEVVAGHVNYPGALLVRAGPGGAAAGALRVRSVDRAAMAVRRLREDHPALLARYPLRYAGDTTDAFLEHYTRAREAVR